MTMHAPFAATLVALVAFGAQAQDSTALPPACATAAGHDMAGMGGGPTGTPAATDPAHADLLAGMQAMAGMAQGMAAADIDVAFVCGMIAHHRGAIAMAEAELAHGDDPWVRGLAEAVIAAQTKEIADMEAWLARQAP